MICPKAGLKMFQSSHGGPLQAPERMPILIHQIKSTFLSTSERKKNNIFTASEAMCVWYDERDRYDSWC